MKKDLKVDGAPTRIWTRDTRIFNHRGI